VSRFTQFPSYLAQRARTARFGEVPVLLAHPDWKTPAPTVLWLHGRTANKELDPGRYLRWLRAGIAACAIDLPGHGERLNAELQSGRHTPDVIAQAVGEIDSVVAGLSSPEYHDVFDLTRLAIGGMSAGGMVALRRLCDPNPFRSAAVEATTGWLTGLYFPTASAANEGDRVSAIQIFAHDRGAITRIDPMDHLARWRPIPLLALHSEADRVVPITGMRMFIDHLKDHYGKMGADPAMVELVTWPHTGAPDEHIGFGKVSNDAKNLQAGFFTRTLGAAPLDSL
jgi:alpha-beta hydrolase superfamily lysophospholipase